MGRIPEPERTILEHLGRYDQLVEIGIGRRTTVASGLAKRGNAVTATDIVDRRAEVPPAVTFVVDDITTPNHTIYEDAEAVYALNMPPELHRPTLEVASRVNADFIFTTLGGDPPVVPVERHSIPLDTLYCSLR